MTTNEDHAATAARLERITQDVGFRISGLEDDIATNKATIASLVESIARDAAEMTDVVKTVGAERVSPTWVQMHVRALVEAHTELRVQRESLNALKRLVGS